ncbi:MAG: DUF1552 domain-containing protein [Bdellovibrionota bacterium]
MYNPRVNRRSFARYVSHSMMAAALSRLFTETQAFGATGSLKTMICTSPNGHVNWESTRAAIKGAMDPALFSKYVLFLENINNAATYNEMTGNTSGDWHVAEGALLSFRPTKDDGPSFFSPLSNLKKIHLTVNSSSRTYIKDTSGGNVALLSDPATAMRTIFGQSYNALSNTDLKLIENGKKNILDPCLDDIKSLRTRLGSDGAHFDDYLYSLQEMYKRLNPPADEVKDMPMDPSMPMDPGNDMSNPKANCKMDVGIKPGNDSKSKHQAMLDVAFQILACDVAQVVSLAYLDNLTDPEHSLIHSAGSGDGGAAFNAFTTDVQSRIARMANSLAANNSGVLDRTAIVYISEGGAHHYNGKFDNNHPVKNIPCLVIGKLGGAIKKTGSLDMKNTTNRHLWRNIADALAGGKADLAQIGGADVSPLDI